MGGVGGSGPTEGAATGVGGGDAVAAGVGSPPPPQPGAAPGAVDLVAFGVGAAAGPGGEGGEAPLGRFYAHQLVSDVALTGGIWILYLQDRGFSLAEIGLAEACFHLAPVTLELPTGSLADAFGRKWSLAIGSLLVAGSAALMLAASSLWVVLPAMYLSGASFAFRSGAQQAFLYDALAERSGTGRFARLFGRLLSASYLVVAATTWLGAVLADVDFAWPYALMVGAGLAGAWLAAGLREPARERASHRNLVRTVGEALRIVRDRPGLAVLLAFSAGLWTLLALIGLYAQAVLAGLGLSTSAVGLVIGATLVCTAVGSWFAHRLGGVGGFRRWSVAASVAIIGAGFGLGSGALALAVGLYLVAEFVAGVYEPLLADRVNTGLGGGQRATILSVQGFLFSLTMIWAFPLTGWIAERGGWLAAYAGAGGVVALLLVAWLAVGGAPGQDAEAVAAQREAEEEVAPDLVARERLVDGPVSLEPPGG